MKTVTVFSLKLYESALDSEKFKSGKPHMVVQLLKLLIAFKKGGKVPYVSKLSPWSKPGAVLVLYEVNLWRG